MHEENLGEKTSGNLPALLFELSARIFNLQSPARAEVVARTITAKYGKL
jgi:hypothetical protein